MTIDKAILQQLEARAQAENITVDALLLRFFEVETTLRQSESRFKMAAQMARLGIWDWEIATDKTVWYGEMFHIYGVSEDEFTGNGADYINFTREDYRRTQADNIKAAFENGISEAEILAGKPIEISPKELVIIRPDGSERITRGDAIAIVDENGKPLRMLGVTVDITEQRKIEEVLRIKDISIEASITPIALADLAGKISYVNRAFLDLWKLSSPEEALGRDATSFWEKPEEAFGIIRAMMQHKAVRGIMRARLNDGSVADIELAASMISDVDGKAICMMGSFTDITQQLQAEQLRLEQERLKASLKKEQEFNILIQKAISALSHDIRTPLTVIANSKQILDRYFDRLDEEQRREKLDIIGKQLHYVLELLNEMSLTIKGRLDERIFQARPVNLPALCMASINEIQETVGSKHKFVFRGDEHVQIVQADETLISRILLNLLSNAVKFSPEGSEICLDLRLDGDAIQLIVSDTGMGISSEDLSQIFEPFYRSEAVRNIRGTGLGLNIVQDCVERHQGQIQVQSALGKGTSFIVTIPHVALI